MKMYVPQRLIICKIIFFLYYACTIALVLLKEALPNRTEIIIVNSLLNPFQSYTMRNCVLTMIGEMLMRVLSTDDIDDKLKSVREDFLDNLEVRKPDRMLKKCESIVRSDRL